MEAVIQSFKRYVLKIFGLRLEPKSWNGKGLPFFLQELYVLYSVSLLGKTCLLAVPNRSDAATPAAIKKHLMHLQKISGFPCIYVVAEASSHNRHRLVKHGAQFVIPGRQIYLPTLGVDWTERRPHEQKHRTTLVKQLSPSSQTVVIYSMTQPEKAFTPLKLAKALNYTPMTMTRALNELETFGIGKIVRKGKERLINFPPHPSEIWKQSLPFFQNPVKKRMWLKLNDREFNKIKHQGVLAGLSALAEISMLADPSHPVYAVSLQTWKSLQQSRSIEILPNSDGADIEIEVWSYEPLLFTTEEGVDRFSLYLSLKDTIDERVESALKKLLKEL